MLASVFDRSPNPKIIVRLVDNSQQPVEFRLTEATGLSGDFALQLLWLLGLGEWRHVGKAKAMLPDAG
jgi:hypothetical protein